jgi:outer membrane lipoprotein-sorting protein
MKNYFFTILLFSTFIFVSIIKAEDIQLTPNQIEIIKKIDSFYNENPTLKSHITQIKNNETEVKGVLILSRPYNMRVEYDEDDTIIITNEETITMQSKAKKQRSYIPMDETSLKFIIGEQKSLLDTEKFKIINFEEKDDSISITIVGTSFYIYSIGSATLIFDKTTLKIKEWILVNNSNTIKLLFDAPEISNKQIPVNIFNIEKIETMDFNSI